MSDHSTQPPAEQPRDDRDAVVPKLLKRFFGEPSNGWPNVPKDLRAIVNGSPLVFGFLLFLAWPASMYTINGRSVARHEFLWMAGPLVALLILYSLVTAYAIWRERRWVREWSVLVAVAILLHQAWYLDFDVPLVAWIIFAWVIGATVWFWYFKRDIAAYYAR